MAVRATPACRLSSLGPHIIVKDETDEVKTPHVLRFIVMKVQGPRQRAPRAALRGRVTAARRCGRQVNKIGMKKKRILYLDCQRKCLRSLNVKEAAKDTPLTGITRVQASVAGRVMAGTYVLCSART